MCILQPYGVRPEPPQVEHLTLAHCVCPRQVFELKMMSSNLFVLIVTLLFLHDASLVRLQLLNEAVLGHLLRHDVVVVFERHLRIMD